MIPIFPYFLFFCRFYYNVRSFTCDMQETEVTYPIPDSSFISFFIGFLRFLFVLLLFLLLTDIPPENYQPLVDFLLCEYKQELFKSHYPSSYSWLVDNHGDRKLPVFCYSSYQPYGFFHRARAILADPAMEYRTPEQMLKIISVSTLQTYVEHLPLESLPYKDADNLKNYARVLAYVGAKFLLPDCTYLHCYSSYLYFNSGPIHSVVPSVVYEVSAGIQYTDMGTGSPKCRLGVGLQVSCDVRWETTLLFTMLSVGAGIAAAIIIKGL